MGSSFNYNSICCFDDESCISAVEGCTDPTAFNYDASANTDNVHVFHLFMVVQMTQCLITTLMQILILMVCYVFHLFQAVQMALFNYAINANTDDGSCVAVVEGCTFEEAFNYDASATQTMVHVFQ